MNNRSLEARDRIALIGISLVGIPFRVCERRERRCDKMEARGTNMSHFTANEEIFWFERVQRVHSLQGRWHADTCLD
jgi:hypothetical protein